MFRDPERSLFNVRGQRFKQHGAFYFPEYPSTFPLIIRYINSNQLKVLNDHKDSQGAIKCQNLFSIAISDKCNNLREGNIKLFRIKRMTISYKNMAIPMKS